MTGVPMYKDGVLYLDNVWLESADQLYSDLIRTFLGDTVTQSLRYPLFEEMQRLTRQASEQDNYEIRVPSLSVEAIRVTPGAIVFL